MIFFFFNDTATTEIYTLSLHDALPISLASGGSGEPKCRPMGFSPLGRKSFTNVWFTTATVGAASTSCVRSEEHTSELQSRLHLVCRLLLEKKKHIHTDSHQ